VISLGIWMAGGSPLALYHNYRYVSATMAKLSNGGPGLWRFVSWVYMEATDQPGLVLDMKISRPALAAWTALSGVLCLGVLLAFAARLGLQRGECPGPAHGAASRWMRRPDACWPDAHVAFAVLTMGTLVVSQFGPRAHINHSYVAMVMLAPFALQDRVLLRLWIAMNVMLGLAHLSVFKLGDPVVILSPSLWSRYPHAGPLLDRIRELPAYSLPDGLLRFQAAVNDALAWLPGPRGISMMSALVCLVACGLVWRMFLAVEPASRPGPCTSR
jgi:hypothetical protein